MASAEDFKGKFKFTSNAPKEDIFGTASGSADLKINTADISALRGTIKVPVKTMKTGNETRDEHMVSAAWLDAAQYPEITFEITEVEPQGAVTDEGGVKTAKVKAKGNFTLHGVTTPLTAPATIKWKADGKAKITTSFAIKLADYKVQGKDGVVGSKVGETIKCQASLVGKVQ
jgi:polyisoprenoid-binding protein YceI